MTLTIRRNLITNVDDAKHVLRFKRARFCGKITGSRLGAVLGINKYESDFKAACLISRLCSIYEPTKYTEAGNVIEPIIRQYVRVNGNALLSESLGLKGSISAEDPIPADQCGYDHFPENPVFGGLVDGYITEDGKRVAILEIKTAGSTEGWLDENGDFTRAPESYILQASLYAKLSGLKKIVFAVGFLEEKDYDSPSKFAVTEDNFRIVVMDAKDITEEMERAEKWFDEHIVNGVTPEWRESDLPLLNQLITLEPQVLSDTQMMPFREYVLKAEAGEDTRESIADVKSTMSKCVFGTLRRMVFNTEGYCFCYDSRDDSLTVSKVTN